MFHPGKFPTTQIEGNFRYFTFPGVGLMQFAFIATFLILFGLPFAHATTYSWVQGEGCTVLSPDTPTTCWSPAGTPTSYDAIVFPSASNVTIVCPNDFLGTENGFETIIYSYGQVHTFEVQQLTVESEAVLTITSNVSLIIHEDSEIAVGGNLVLNGILAAIDGNGLLTVNGNFTMIGGNAQGKGRLIVNEGGFLVLSSETSGENYLLRQTKVYGTMLQTGINAVTHTGFWWQSGEVIVEVFGVLIMESGYLYDWEEEGMLVIQKGGSYNVTSVQMRGLYLLNYGNITFGDSFINLNSMALNQAVENHGVITLASENYWFQLINVVNDAGIVFITDNTGFQCNLFDTDGIYYVDEFAQATFQAGVQTGGYPPRSYGPYGGFVIQYYGEVLFNQTTLAGPGSYLVTGGFYMNGNLYINSTINFEIRLGFVTVENSNITITEGNSVTLTSGIFNATQNAANSSSYIHVFGDVEVSYYKAYWFYEDYTSSISTNLIFVLHEGSSLSIEASASLIFWGDGSVMNCGGTFNNYGTLQGEETPCSLSSDELSLLRLETHKHSLSVHNRLSQNLSYASYAQSHEL